MEARWLWTDFLFRPRSQSRKHYVQPELHILIFHICYFINSTYLDGSFLLSPRMNGLLSVFSLCGVSVICDSAPISQYPLLLAPVDVANSLNVYQPTLWLQMSHSNLSLSLSGNPSHMCHPFISLGKTWKGSSSSCGTSGSCVCPAAQRGTVASCMTWGQRERETEGGGMGLRRRARNWKR